MNAIAPARISALVLLAYLLFVALKLFDYGGDVSRFVVAGDYFFDRPNLVAPIHVEDHSYGYDGQFYYRLGLDPWTTRRTDFGITIDSPVVRAQRIVYPILAWTSSFGRPAALPYALIAINLIAVAGIGWLGALFARDVGVPAWSGALLAFYPGFVLSIARDTTEIVAAFFGLVAILLAGRGRFITAGTAAAIAVLSKETTLPYLIGFGIVALKDAVRDRTVWRRVVALAVPAVAFALWQITLLHLWGASPSSDLGSHDIDAIPLLSYFRYVVSYGRAIFETPVRYRILFSFVAILSVAGLTTMTLKSLSVTRTVPLSLVIPWSIYGLLAAFFAADIWNEPYGFLRVLADLYLFSILILIRSADRNLLNRLGFAIGFVWLGAAAFAWSLSD